MKKSIKIIRNPYEEPDHVNLIFKASNGESSGQLEIYDYADRLKELATILEDFPFQSKTYYLWELGIEKPKGNFAFYFKCEFSQIKLSNDCNIGIRLNNNKEGIDASISEFNIICHSSELKLLGQLFREFSKLEKETLFWNGFDGFVE